MTFQIWLMCVAFLLAAWKIDTDLIRIEHDLSVIAVEQIKIEHQDNIENQSAYVKK